MTETGDIGKYHILTELGRGGFAVTYRARDRDLDREVALKVLKPGWMEDTVAVERFLREARAAAKLHHPQIAAIYDVGQVEGRLFIAMHLVEGHSLDRLLRENGPLAWDTALKVLDNIARALDYAHARGLIHRDVKPANIVVSDEEGAVLTDFGLVKAAQSASTTSANLTGASTPGTSAYIAPEIWSGQPATAASDLYALAAVAGEMLGGKQLFGGDTLEAVIARHLALGPAWPETWPNGVPGDAPAVLEKALKRAPAERYSTLIEFVSALRKTEEKSQPEPIPPVPIASTASHMPEQSTSRQGPSPLKKHWPVIGGIALIFVLGAIGLGSILLGSAAPSPTPSPVVAALSTTVPPTPTEPATFTPSPSPTLEPMPTAEPSLTPTATPSLEEVAFMNSAHADAQAMAFRDWDSTGEVPANCAKCHSAGGLPQFIHNNGTIAVTKSGATTTGVVGQPPANGFACATCHDTNNFPNRLPVVNVPFPNGKTLTFSTEKDDKGNLKPVDANLCLECHQGRESTVTMNNYLAGKDPGTVDPKISFKNVHYFAAGATLFGDAAQGAYQYEGQKYDGQNTEHPLNKCTDCHDVHTLKVEVAKCAACHNVKTTEDLQNIRMSAIDFNGNGDVTEGIYKEIDSYRVALYAALQKYAADKAGTPIVYDGASYPYFFVAGADGKPAKDDKGAAIGYNAWTPDLLKAAYNYQYSVKDPGAFAHNPQYVMQFLYDSFKSLGGDVRSLTRP